MDTRRVSAPVTWCAGKSSFASWIVARFPPHTCYVEPFGGGAQLLFAKSPSAIEVYNDLDSELVEFFRMLKSVEGFSRWYRAVQRVPYSLWVRRAFKTGTLASLENRLVRIALWYGGARMGFNNGILSG